MIAYMGHVRLVSYIVYFLFSLSNAKWHLMSDIYDLSMTDNSKVDPTVSFRVFLPESLRRDFKVRCAQEGTNMSEKSRELIEEWLKNRKNRID